MKASGERMYPFGFFTILLIISANGQRLRDNMYESLYREGVCYKRFNGTHEIGCSSKYGGTVGIVHIYNNDLKWILEESKTGPYAVVVSIEMFKRDLIMKLVERPDKIAGLLVINNGTARPENFTHQPRCPNSGSQAPQEALRCREDAPTVWNPWGTGLMHINYPFPVFYLPQEKAAKDIQHIYECFYKFNSFDLDNQAERSLCAVEMDSFMYGAVNTAVCMKRSITNHHLSSTRFCDPLGDKSVFTTLFARGTFQEMSQDYFKEGGENKPVERSAISEPPGSVALVTAQMDGTSFFEDDGINAVGTVSGMVLLMATNQLLHRMFSGDDTKDYGKNILFVLLNGESYDYIGSQRMAWELTNHKFLEPVMSAEALGPHVHLGQFTGRKEAQLNAFTPKYNEDNKNTKVDEFLSWMKFPVSVHRDQSLPPSSLHSFLRLLNSSHLSSTVLADHHGNNFSTPYYQSIFDDGQNLDYKYLNISFNTSNLPSDVYPDFSIPDAQVPVNTVQARLAKISTAVGLALYRHVTGREYTGNLTASPYIIDELLHCYLDTTSCRLITMAVSADSSNPPTQQFPPSSLYVGVHVWPSQHSRITALVTALLTGRQINRTRKECKSDDDTICWYTWMSGWSGKGSCVRTHTNHIAALSPAFEIEDYNFTSGHYSSWSESVWSSMSLRLLVVPPPLHEAVTLALGGTVMAVALLLVTCCTRHVASLQPESSSEEEIVREGDQSVNC